MSSSLLSLLPPPSEARTGWPWTEETPPSVFLPAPAGGWPKITIVCPSFRQGKFLEETIRSVLLQNYPALEFIVIDGGSDDGTVALLKNYSAWISHWESMPDRGQSHAINKGCSRATGELIGWINSDDYYFPGAFAAIGRVFRVTPDRLIFGDWAERTSTEPILKLQRERPAFAFQVVVGARHLPSHATFWPRAWHQPVNETLRFTMDADLFKRLAASGLKPHYLPQPLGVFRRHPDAKTSTIVDVAQAESEAWGRTQPRFTHVRWLVGRALDRVLRLLYQTRSD